MANFNPEQFSYRLERPEDAPVVEALLDRAFGPGRHARTTYRLREGVEHLAELALIGEFEGVVVGTMRFWPVRIGEDGEALMLGPLAIDPSKQNMGCGLGLMRLGLKMAGEAGHRLVFLVGDPPYYGRAGFMPVPPGHLVLPGPVDRRRILYVDLVDGALKTMKGHVSKARRRAAQASDDHQS